MKAQSIFNLPSGLRFRENERYFLFSLILEIFFKLFKNTKEQVTMNKFVNSAIVTLAVLGLGSIAHADTAPAAVKLGYVDMQKAIQETSAGKKAKKDLEDEYNKKKKEIEKKEADLKKMNEDLEKKAMVLSEEVRAKKAQDLQAEMLKYRELVGKSQMEIQKREQELTKPIVDGLRKVMGDIAEKDGYTMILERSEQSVLWAKKDADLTSRMIAEYEKSAPKKK